MLTRRAPTRCGSYSNATDLSAQSQCLPCPPGSACTTGSVAPLPCAAGSMQAEEGSSACVYCGAGYFQNASGSTGCVPCPGGTYSSIRGSAECSHCLARLSSYEGSTSCSVCAAGYFRRNAATVATPQACDDSLCNAPGVYCPEDSTLETLVLLPGYWRLSNRSRKITKCSGGNATARCKGGTGTTLPVALPRRQLEQPRRAVAASSTLEGDVYCGELYTGPG